MTEARLCHVHADRGDGHGRLGLVRHSRARSASARIVDADGNDVPRGEIGELLRARAAASCKATTRIRRRRADAFSGEWFRTGDLFRQDERGYFYIVGRLKDMIRRSRREHRRARGRNGDDGASRGRWRRRASRCRTRCAAKRSRPTSSCSRDSRRTTCRRSASSSTAARDLAPFKVPRYIAYRTELPKTPSGKIAKKVLTEGITDLRSGSYDRVEERWL